MRCGWVSKCGAALAVWLGSTSILPSAAAEAPNAIYEELFSPAASPQLVNLRLPPPTMNDDLDVAAQHKALAQIADDSRPLEALLRKSIVAPFVLKISDEKTPGAGLAGTGRRVDVWFIVHGDFARLTSEDFLLNQITPETRSDQGKANFQGHTLTSSELHVRQIVPAPNERLFHLAFNLFDRVQVSATNHAMLTRSDESALVAGRIDPRFDSDGTLANRWQSLSRDSLGRLQAGPPHAYHSAIWYVKATRLHEPAGAMLVEHHIAFDEPQAWFDGANLLRSKLPLLVQDAIRRFRRKAADAR